MYSLRWMEDPWSKELQQGNNDPAILPDLYKPHFLSSIPSLYFVLTSIWSRESPFIIHYQSQGPSQP